MTDLLTDRQRARLTELEIRRSKPPAAGNVIRYDTEVPGFGLRITAAGARSFVLNYRCDGRERRLTIGTWPAWSATAGRERAKELRRQIEQGIDPLATRSARRGALTLASLADDYVKRYAEVMKKSWREDDRILRVNACRSWALPRPRRSTGATSWACWIRSPSGHRSWPTEP